MTLHLVPRRAALAALALALSAFLAPAAASQDLRTRANRAVHALRAEQRPDGSYGGTVSTTAATLYGFARCAREYREADGPFMARAVEFLLKCARDDGSISAAGDADKTASTMWAALALHALDKKKHEAKIRAAMDYVAKASGKSVAAGASPEELAFQATPDLLPSASPGEDGMKEGVAALDQGVRPDGGYADAATTAKRLVLMNRLAALNPPPKTEERPAVALPPFDPAAKADVDAAMKKAIQFLLSRRMPTGGFGSAATKGQDLGITALAAQALWCWPGEMPADVRDAAKKATEIVFAGARPDGSIHGGGLENYTTSASLGALVRSGDARYKPAIEKARAFLEKLQGDESEGYSKSDWAYGGFGYGDEERPDLSNTQFAMDALKLAGAAPDDPAIRRALIFLERCQNRSESNHVEISRDGVTAVAGNDGGGVYYPGNSKAGMEKLPDGKVVPRSYGSMTYALLKGFVFAGVPKDDPRMKDALAWCRAHYTLDRVPGYEEMAKASPRAAYQGLFYYFLTMANALSAYGGDVIETPDGKKHNWREELASRLVSLQRPDGSFVNENSARWYEGDDVLATSYAVLTLAALKK